MNAGVDLGPYRRVYVRMWDDKNFRALAPLQPGGQALWIYLLTCPATLAVPGMIRSTMEGLAAELMWSLEAFTEAFAEAFRLGMVKASWPDRLVWIPMALRYNPPASLNAVMGWRRSFATVPECALKDEARVAVEAYLLPYGEGFVEAFGKPSEKASRRANACALSGSGSGSGSGAGSGAVREEPAPRTEARRQPRRTKTVGNAAVQACTDAFRVNLPAWKPAGRDPKLLVAICARNGVEVVSRWIQGPLWDHCQRFPYLERMGYGAAALAAQEHVLQKMDQDNGGGSNGR